jgi:hypothetical protein
MGLALLLVAGYAVYRIGFGKPFTIDELADRYMGQPGQACAYKVGQLKILELRERAKAALGPKFSLKDFHTVVLENGGVPLTLLDSLVDEWILKTKDLQRPARTAANPFDIPNQPFVPLLA